MFSVSYLEFHVKNTVFRWKDEKKSIVKNILKYEYFVTWYNISADDTNLYHYNKCECVWIDWLAVNSESIVLG